MFLKPQPRSGPASGRITGEHRDCASIGCTFGTGCRCHTRRRNPQPHRILDCTGAATAVYRGLGTDVELARPVPSLYGQRRSIVKLRGMLEAVEGRQIMIDPECSLFL